MVKVAPAAAGCDHGEGCTMVKVAPRRQDATRRKLVPASLTVIPAFAGIHTEIQLKHKPTGQTESQNAAVDAISQMQNMSRYDRRHTRIAEQGARNHGAAKAADSSEDV